MSILDGLLAAAALNRLELAFCVIAVLGGAYLKGYTGFGASMLWVTSLSFVLPPVQVVPMVLMFEVATSIYLLPQIWRQVEWKSIAMLLVGTWAATPLGIYALASLPADPVRVTLGVAVMAAAILMLRGFALRRIPGRAATLGIGGLAGILNGSMGIVGPPVILFYFSSPIGIAVGRASIVTYFIGTDSVGTLMFAAQGLIGVNVLSRTALFLPLLFLGVAAGNRGFLRTDAETFKNIALFVLMALSGGLIARALWPN
ncbi:MAG TPA: sulfite exporter TauE/SafE family protein [Gammaproteobacteria bacterium]|nr:sulfite exporter TauE/SafE family protein [Gammaproteobacteria bacterium]